MIANWTFDIYTPRTLALSVIEAYRRQEELVIGAEVTHSGDSLRMWLEVVDEIDVCGYDPRRVLKWLEFGDVMFFWQDRNIDKTLITISMALDIWTRGYLLERAS